MKARLRSPIPIIAVLLAANHSSHAGPWSTEPVVGVAAQYSSNPELLEGPGARSETRGALLVDLPIDYQEDALHFSFYPRLRYSGDAGYSSLTSDYYHVDTSLLYSRDDGSISLSSAYYIDSSLLYAAEISNGVGVRRNTLNVDLDLQRALSERLGFQMDLTTQRTTYGAEAAQTNLVDYRYSTAAPSLSYEFTERDTLKVTGSEARYDSLNALTSSKSAQVRLGLERKLTELWTLSASVGYSSSTNKFKLYEFGVLLETIESTERGGVYSLTLARQTDQWGVTAALSQSVTPTGFAYLTRQDSVTLQGNYRPNEHLNFGANGYFADLRDPQVSGNGDIYRRYFSATAWGEWRWTPLWVCTLRVEKVAQHLPQPLGNPNSTGFSVEIARHFNRTNQ